MIEMNVLRAIASAANFVLLFGTQLLRLAPLMPQWIS